MDQTSGKKLIIFFVIYFCLAWILTWTYYTTHLKFIPEEWNSWHQHIAQGKLEGSNQFRLLSFWAAEVAKIAFNQPIYAAYLIVRFFFTFLTLCLFHLFLLSWFNHEKSFLSTIFLVAIMPVTYLPFLQESDVILQFFFLLGLWVVKEKKVWLLAILLLVATFAKETIVFLIPFYFFLYWGKEKKSRVVLNSTLLLLIWLGALYLSRNVFYEGSNSPFLGWQLPHNLSQIKIFFKYNPLTGIHLLYLPFLGIFWILPFLKIREKPYFFQKAAPYIIVYLVLNFLFGWPEETRILLPIAFLIIPSGIMTLFKEESKKQPYY